MTTPPCAGRWELFDSTDYRDHLDARAYCVDCPLIVECQKRLEEAHELAYALKYGGGPSGTWAGQLVGARKNASTDITRNPRAARIAAEDAMWPEEEARKAHAAWFRGERTPTIYAGERAYQRQKARQKRRRLAA